MAFLVKGTTIVGANIDIGKETTAADVVYDNTESGLEATNVQDAIDSLAGSAAFVIIDGKLCLRYKED